MNGLTRSRLVAIRLAVVMLALVIAIPFQAAQPVFDSGLVASNKTNLFNYDYQPALIVPRGEREQRVRDRPVEPDPIFLLDAAAVPVLARADREDVSLHQADRDAAENTSWQTPRQRPSAPRAPPVSLS